MSRANSIIEEIKNKSILKKNAAGSDYFSLSVEDCRKTASRFRFDLRSIELLALENQIIPERYQRNMGTLGIDGQLKLLSSSVAVVGLGGLGGLTAQLLARMGIGKLIIVDGDSYSESNLNRQVLSSEENIGDSKGKVTASVIKNINSATEVVFYESFATQENLPEFLDDSKVALDCLDNIPARFDLQEACAKKNITMVHGAVAGYMGQVAVIRPGENLLNNIYAHYKQAVKTTEKIKVEDNTIVSAEAELGNPSATPALVAAWQVSETVKILSDTEEVLQGELLHIDLQYNEITRISLTV